MEGLEGQTARRAVAQWAVVWLIQLRWAAAAGLAAAPLGARLFGTVLPAAIFLALGALVAAYNAVLNLWVRRAGAVPETDIHAQIAGDFLALTVVFHFAGGIANPLLPLYAFHVMVAALVLSRRAGFAYALAAVGLVVSLALAEGSGVLAHRPLTGAPAEDRYRSGGMAAIVVATDAMLLMGVAYLSAVIADVFRRREAELAGLNRRLAEQDRLKSQYVRSLAHSLLRRLEDVEQALASGLRDLPPSGTDVARGMLLRARQWLASLHQFLQDVVDLSRIRAAGTLSMSYVYLPRIVYQQIQDLAALAGERGIRIEADLPDGIPPVRGDAQALGQAVQNVLRNAVVYGSTDSTVRVTAGRHDDVVDVTVENDGMGISADDLPHVFDEFYRAGRARALEPRGSGLGLSITKQVVEQHGGSISVASEEGKGCRFVLSLPLERRAIAERQPEPPGAAESAGQ